MRDNNLEILEKSNFIKDFNRYFKILPPNGGIFHYTDFNAFINIIQNKKFWASHLNFMNDMSEGLVGVKIIERIIKYSDIYKDYESPADLLNEVKKQLKEMNIFVVSFTNKKDDLNQWRGYANTPNGLNICFSPTKLSEKIITARKIERISEIIQKESLQSKMKSTHCILLKCLYDELLQSYLIRDILELFSSYPDKTTMARMLCFCSPFLKDKGFVDEEEWRLVIFSPTSINTVKYRTGKSSIIPYLEFPFNIDAIKSITLAPTSPDKRIQKESVEYFIKSTLKDRVIPIEESQVPYRNW